MSKVFECLVSVRLGLFVERSGMLPTTQFAYWKVWAPVMNFCACPIHCRVYWRVGRSKLVNVVSGVLQGSVLGPLLFLLYTSVLFSISENKLIGCADDSTLMAVVPY